MDDPKDFIDIRQIENTRVAYQNIKPRLIALTSSQLSSYECKPPDNLLGPWLHEGSLAMLHAERGLGKTWVCNSVALAVASGGEFLGFSSEKPRKVVIFDGEMQIYLMQERFNLLKSMFPKFDETNLRLILSGVQPNGLPDLGNKQSYSYYDDVIEDADLIIIDNLSSIVRTIPGNDNDEWATFIEWLIRQRNSGKSVLIIHHSGKNGNSRGASRIEDPLDTIIKLTKPSGHDASDGCHFNWEFTKNRQFHGDDAKPLRGKFTENGWERLEFLPSVDANDIVAMKAAGKSLRDIERETGISKSKVGRILQKPPVPRDTSLADVPRDTEPEMPF